MEGAPNKTEGRKSFGDRYPGFSDVDKSGAKRLGIDTSYVNPAYKSEVPDYRTEHEVINAGADAWDQEEMPAEEPTEDINEVASTETPTGTEEPLVLTEDMRVEPVPELVSETVEDSAEEVAAEVSEIPDVFQGSTETTLVNEQEPEETEDDSEAVNRIMRRLNPANLNEPPSPKPKFVVVEGDGQADVVTEAASATSAEPITETEEAVVLEEPTLKTESIEENSDIKLRDEYLDLIKALEISLLNRINNGDLSTVKDEHKAFSEAAKNLRLFLDIGVTSDGEGKNDIQVSYSDLQKKKFDVLFDKLQSQYQITQEAIDNSHEEVDTKTESSPELASTLKRFIPVQSEKPSKGVAESASVAQEADTSPTEEAVTPDEPTSVVFKDTDEPELPFDDLPNETREDAEARVSRQEAVDNRNDELADVAEIASAAENLMLRELRNKGLQQEWESGAWWGVGRALSQMRVDDFLRTKDAGDKNRVWVADLQQRAGGFAPRLEPRMTLEEYVPKLYQGIIKAQRHAGETGNEGARARLLGI